MLCRFLEICVCLLIFSFVLFFFDFCEDRTIRTSFDMVKCCAPNCQNYFKKDTSKFSFYEFPEDPLLRAKWISNIGRTNWIPGRRSVLCSAHFESSQLTGSGQQLQLCNNAIPTKFLVPKRKRISSDHGVTGCEFGKKESNLFDEECSVDCGEFNQPSKVSQESKLEGTEIIHLYPRNVSPSVKMKLEAGKFTDDLVLIDEDYVVEDCQLIEDAENQSSQFIRKNVTIVEGCSSSTSDDNIIIVQNPVSSLSVGDPPQGADDSVAYGNIIIVESTATADDCSEMLLIHESSHTSPENRMYVQKSTSEFESVRQQSLNLSEIATPCSKSATDTENTSFSMMNPLSISQIGSKTISGPSTKKRKLLATETFQHSAMQKNSSTLLEKCLIDMPVSFANHIMDEEANKLKYSALKWHEDALMCRLCGIASNTTINFFSAEAKEMKLLERMKSILPIMFDESDDLPHIVCSECLSRLDTCSELIVTSFKTHHQLTSVAEQNIEQFLRIPVFFHDCKRKSDKVLKRDILLMELCHTDDKSVEESIRQAFEDLRLRVEPKNTNNEPQCSLVLFPVSDNFSISHVEQIRTAAEALMSKALLCDDGVSQDPSQVFCGEENDVYEQNFGEETSHSAPEEFRTVEDPHFTEITESLELDPNEVQSMPVIDDISPYEFYSTEIRCPKFEAAWQGRGISVKSMQKTFYWVEAGDDKVNLVCRLCKNTVDGNCNIEDHLKGHFGIRCQTCLAVLASNQNADAHKCSQKSLQHCLSQKIRSSFSKRRFCLWYQCSFCSIRQKSKSALEQHLQQHFAANAKCKGCGFDAPNVHEAISHHQKCAEIRKEKEWRCRKCMDTFSNEDDLQKHQASTGHDNKAASWLCDVCGKKFLRSSKLSQHRKTHLPREFQFIHQCPKCPKRYRNMSRLKEHMEKHEEKKYMCKVCGKLFGTKQILRQHEFTHGDPRFLCSVCSRTFFRKSHLVKHMNVHSSGNSRTNRTVPLPNRDGLNRCRECKKVFDQKDLLDHYKESHPHIQLDHYVCEICKEENTSYAELFQHQREVHKTGVKECPFCERTIDSSTQMKYHLMRHEGMFPYNCPLCSNGYTANSILQDHIRRKHTGEKPFVCKQCSKCFPTNGALSQHLTVHSLPHQLLPCPVCNQGFKRKAHLDVHIRTHTGEKPYPCPICDRPFRQRPDCVKHVRVIHGEDPSKFNIQFQPNISTTFPPFVSVADMELVLEGEDLMQESAEVDQLLVSQEEDCEH